MPTSAIASGHIDFCGSPAQIAAKITEGNGVQSEAVKGDHMPTHSAALLQEVFHEIKMIFGTDLSNYKLATLERRFDRRVMLLRCESREAYVNLARNSKEEMCALHRDLLISVTSFFRDGEPFDRLGKSVIPKLLADKKTGQPMRIWVPACASGEEAYTLGILLLEALEQAAEAGKSPAPAPAPAQVFATDVNQEAIAAARRGIYSKDIRESVSAERLERFFISCDQGYRVCRRLRDLVVFSAHDVLANPPFSRIDLVSCRNFLIYLQPAGQQKVLSAFHYALMPGGFLLLGASETIGESPDLFTVADPKNKFYARKHAPARRGHRLPQTPSMEACQDLFGAPLRRPATLRSLAERQIIDVYGPPGVVVDEHFEVLQFCGDIGPFLTPASGAASFNLLRLVRFDLHIELKRTMTTALAEQRRLQATITLHDTKRLRQVNIDIMPMLDPHSQQRCLLVLFLASPEAPLVDLLASSTQEDMTSTMAGSPVQVTRLSNELKTTQDYLRAVIEEAESAREGFKVANEELQSANEELQTTNEELETSKEELQSANEELTTVNEELGGRMVELRQINDDLHNFLSATQSIVITVDLKLVIRRWTQATELVLALRSQDVGRPLSWLEQFMSCERLADKASAVIESLAIYEEKIHSRAGGNFELRISPYKTLDHAIRGVILRLIPVAAAAKLDLELGLGAIAQPLCALDSALHLRWGNAAFFRLVGISRHVHLGRDIKNTNVLGSLPVEALSRIRRAARSGRRLRRLDVDVDASAWTLTGSPLHDHRLGPLLLLAWEVRHAA